MTKKNGEYISNPYKMYGIVEKAYITKADETVTVNPETGEMYVMKKIGKNVKIMHDELVYTKLFKDNVEKLIKLPHPALKIVLYAMSIVKPMQELVVLNCDDVSLACNIANSTFFSSMNYLLDNKILARKLGSNLEFWFDPNIFFNGNRVKVK